MTAWLIPGYEMGKGRVHPALGVVFYGGNFAVRREALARIGGFETSIESHGEDTNLGRTGVRDWPSRIAKRLLSLYVGAPL